MENNIVKQDLMDGIVFRGQKAQNPVIQKIEDEGAKKLKSWPPTVQDFYAGLFKQKPELNELANSPLQSAIKEVMGTQEWKNLREHTRLDEFGSSVGTASFSKSFIDNLSQEIIDAENAVVEQSKAVSALREARRIKDKALIKEMLELAKQKREAAKKAVSNAAQACGGDITQSVRIAGRNAANEASGATQESKDFACAWGDGGGFANHIPVSEQLALANKIKENKTLRLLAKMVGRMKRLAQGFQAKKINKTPEEIVDVETGNDLKRVLPAEMLFLTNPKTRMIFYKKYYEMSLLQYKKTGVEKAGKGPIFLMTDESGSMSGNRIIWAKAVGLALAWIAQKQKRSLILGGFSSSGQIWTKEYPGGIISPAEVEEYANHFYDGGTDFEMALTRSIEDIKKSKFMKKADLVFVSDGDCWCSESFVEEFKRKKHDLGLRVISIGVGCSEESFTHFSDVSFGFNGKLDGDEIALERVFSI